MAAGRRLVFHDQLGAANTITVLFGVRDDFPARGEFRPIGMLFVEVMQELIPHVAAVLIDADDSLFA